MCIGSMVFSMELLLRLIVLFLLYSPKVLKIIMPWDNILIATTSKKCTQYCILSSIQNCWMYKSSSLQWLFIDGKCCRKKTRLYMPTYKRQHNANARMHNLCSAIILRTEKGKLYWSSIHTAFNAANMLKTTCCVMGSSTTKIVSQLFFF